MKDQDTYNKLSIILTKCGFAKAKVIRIATVLADVSKVITVKYNGKIQRMLRLYGSVLKTDMIQTFKKISLTKKEIEFATTLWLQNTMNISLSLLHPALMKFCHKHKITFSELEEVADEIDMNIAVLDDIILYASSK